MYRYIRNKLLRVYKWIRFKITGTYVCYLCGPMSAAVETCNVWRQDVEKEFKNCNIKFINPVAEEAKKTSLQLKESMIKLKGWQRSGKHKKLIRVMARIKKLDLQAVKASDFIIAFWSNKIPTFGTCSELDKAEDLCVPVYSFTPDNITDLNPWLFLDLINYDKYYVGHTLKEILKELKEDFSIIKIK